MNPLYLAITPPLIGTVAGYLASRATIRLLLRPRRPWRLFGLPLPLTPGAIQAGRHAFADEVGKVMGRQLFTRADAEQAISGAGFQEALRDRLDRRLDEIMNREFGPLASLVPARFTSYFEIGVKVLRWRLLKQLHAQGGQALQGAVQTPRGKEELQGEEAAAAGHPPAPRKMLDKVVTDLLEERILSQPLGKLSGLLPKAVQEGIGDSLQQQASALLLSELPALVDSLDIGALVSRKLEALDPLQFEDLLLGLMQERFRYIHFFGALLGFLIGVGALLCITGL